MFSIKRTIVLAAGLGIVSAQSISSKCQQTLASVVLSSAGQCLNAQALVAIATVDSNSSLVGPINNWLTGLCAKPACTNDTLSTLVQNVTSGCSTELQSFGLGNVSEGDIATVIEQAYPTFREVVCLTDANDNGALCVTETLTNIESLTGTLNEAEVGSLVTQISQGTLTNIPANVTCTDCVKEAFNVINTSYPGLINSAAINTIDNQCGANFTDGIAPSEISQSATTSTASPVSAAANGALSFGAGPIGVLISSLLSLGAAIAIIA